MNAIDIVKRLQAELVADRELNDWSAEHAGGPLIVQLGSSPQQERDLRAPCLVLTGWTTDYDAQGGESETFVKLQCVAPAGEQRREGRAVTYPGALIAEELAERAWAIVLAKRVGLGRLRLEGDGGQVIGKYAFSFKDLIFTQRNTNTR